MSFSLYSVHRFGFYSFSRRLLLVLLLGGHFSSSRCLWHNVWCVCQRYPKIYADIYYVLGFRRAVNVLRFFITESTLYVAIEWWIRLASCCRLTINGRGRCIPYRLHWKFRVSYACSQTSPPATATQTSFALSLKWNWYLGIIQSGVLIFDTEHLQLSRIFTTVAVCVNPAR